jgi:uncharacterized protein (TIGR02246 family)
MSELTVTAIHDAVLEANELFMDRFNQGDAAGMAELYTEEGQVLPPNGDFLTGRPAIQALWQGVMDMGIKEVELEIVEVEGRDDTAFEVSTYKLLDENGQTLDHGKYIVIWKQEDGDWKLHRDIFNSSVPAATT